jgi:hypothetical protein
MYQAGIPILAGTGSNLELGSPFKVLHRDSLHHELQPLVGVGLLNIDALRAATSQPAKHFRLEAR